MQKSKAVRAVGKRLSQSLDTQYSGASTGTPSSVRSLDEPAQYSNAASAPTIGENCIAIYTRADVLLTRARAIEQRLSGTGSTNDLPCDLADANQIPLIQVLHHVGVILGVLDQSLDAIGRALGVGE